MQEKIRVDCPHEIEELIDKHCTYVDHLLHIGGKHILDPRCALPYMPAYIKHAPITAEKLFFALSGANVPRNTYVHKTHKDETLRGPYSLEEFKLLKKYFRSVGFAAVGVLLQEKLETLIPHNTSRKV